MDNSGYFALSKMDATSLRDAVADHFYSEAMHDRDVERAHKAQDLWSERVKVGY